MLLFMPFEEREYFTKIGWRFRIMSFISMPVFILIVFVWFVSNLQ